MYLHSFVERHGFVLLSQCISLIILRVCLHIFASIIKVLNTVTKDLGIYNNLFSLSMHMRKQCSDLTHSMNVSSGFHYVLQIGEQFSWPFFPRCHAFICDSCILFVGRSRLITKCFISVITWGSITPTDEWCKFSDFDKLGFYFDKHLLCHSAITTMCYYYERYVSSLLNCEPLHHNLCCCPAQILCQKVPHLHLKWMISSFFIAMKLWSVDFIWCAIVTMLFMD